MNFYTKINDELTDLKGARLGMPSVDRVETNAIGLGITIEFKIWEPCLKFEKNGAMRIVHPIPRTTKSAHRGCSSLLKSQVLRSHLVCSMEGFERPSPSFQFGAG